MESQVLRCGDVSLTPFGEGDALQLHEWRSRLLDFVPWWCGDRSLLNEGDFQDEFLRAEGTRRHIRMMIECDDCGVGTVCSYDYNPSDGWVYVAIFVDPEIQDRQRIGQIAFARFAHYLFNSDHSLRMIYCKVPGYDRKYAEAFDRNKFEPVAILPEHLFWNGGYHDQLIYRIDRERHRDIRAYIHLKCKNLSVA